MDPYRTLHLALLSVLVLFFAVSAFADPGYQNYGVYYTGDDLGVYYYEYYNDAYYLYHYPHTSYNGVYSDVYFSSASYYSPYGVYYHAWPYGYTVMDNYAYYPSYVVPDSTAYYPPVLEDFYGYAYPYFDYYRYYIPYGGYRYYEYDGYHYDYGYQPTYSYYRSYGYPYYGHYYPSDHRAGRFGDAGTVDVELGPEPIVYPRVDNSPDFQRTFYPSDYSDGVALEHADSPSSSTGTGTTSIVVLTPQDSNETPGPGQDNEAGGQTLVQAQAYSPSCGMVVVNAESVSLEAGERKTVSFSLQNTAFEDFTIDRVNAWTDHPEVEVFEGSFSSRIGANGSGSLTLTVDAQEDAVNTQAHVTVYGHFENGKSCGFQEVKEDFSLFVSGQTQTNAACADFKLELPSSARLDDGRFLVKITNPLAREAIVSVEGKGVSVNPTTIQVPANSFVEKNVFFEAEGVAEQVRFNLSLPGCQVLSKYVPIESDGSAAFQGLALTGVPGELTLDSEVRELVNGGYAIDLHFKNSTTEKLSGRIEFADSAWHVLSGNSITLQPQSEENVSLVISPNNLIDKPTFIPVSFVLSNGKRLTTYAAFYPLSGAVGTAFFSLTNSSFALGALVVILVLAVYASRKYGWRFLAHRQARATLAQEVRDVDPSVYDQPLPMKEALEPKQTRMDDFDEDVYF
jgi:hypothetical protein